MGHIHLAAAPDTRRWRMVVHLLDEGAAIGRIVRASALAAESDLAVAARDPALAEAVRLLATIPQAARSPNFSDALRGSGVETPGAPMLGDLAIGTAAALDRFTERRTDFSEIVRRSLVGTMSSLVEEALPSPFEPSASDVQRAAARLGQPAGFARASRTLLGRVQADTLGAWLDRTLSQEIGPGTRMASFAARDRFDRRLDQHCMEATRIIREFSGNWYGRTLLREGSISHERAAAYTAVAMRKIGEELRRNPDAYA